MLGLIKNGFRIFGDMYMIWEFRIRLLDMYGFNVKGMLFYKVLENINLFDLLLLWK